MLLPFFVAPFVFPYAMYQCIFYRIVILRPLAERQNKTTGGYEK